MRKKALLLFLVLTDIFLLSGCWNYVELDQQINVSGFALDVGQPGFKYHLSAEVVTVGKNQKDEMNVNVMETDADTLFEGVRNLMTLASKKLYFGHCKTIVIGEDLAKEGIFEAMDFPIRNHELRIETDVMIAKGNTGKEILLSEGVSTNIAAYKLYDLTKTFFKSIGEVLTHKLFLVYNSMQMEGGSTIIPCVELRMVEDEKVAKLVGGAVFRGDKLIGYLNEHQVKNLSLMSNKQKDGLLTYKNPENPENYISAEIYKNKSKIELSFSDKGPEASVTVNTAVIVGEVETQFDFTKPEEIERFRHMLESQSDKEFEELMGKAQKGLKCDILGVGKLIQEKYPQLWEKYKDNWDEMFCKMPVKVKTNIKITGSGIESKSGTIKE